ncbi:hypothetical protein AM587_10002333 [Phytophthora nicotianae]|uniref:Uncharacterized protein n=1 Tax=Phytophthora nicotianae TaxID=4792 RepID=A0A0W8CP69_PHYNI|nr:hypothetical protein AM587_10002333 [Phytophthora nicotianae]
MTKKCTPQEIQEIKEYLNGLLDRDADDTASTDVDAIEAAFWERLQPRLFQNSHSSGADQLAKVVQATIDGDDSVGLTSTVLLIPAVDPTVGAAAASAASSSSSKSSKPRKSRKREASATRNRAKASTKKLKTRSASKSASQLQNPLPAVLQDRVYADINKGTYQVTEPPSLTKAELDNDDWSDFEDEDGNPTAYPPGTLDPDAREGDGDEAGDDEGSPDTSDAELKAKLNQ